MHKLRKCLGPWVAEWLEHRTPDQKVWVRDPMPPNTLRVHTLYVLVKSVGPKILWVVTTEIRSTGVGEYFPPSSSILKLWRYVGSPSIVKKSNLYQALATFIPSFREGHNNSKKVPNWNG
ncbi:hypothetical protein TNCV_4926441 [Trichonephila clavipes]|nr:hypothetical protein TNCV_4926441 [Trichonephila clavipes]